MIWLGLAVYQTDINCRAYKNCRQSQIFFKKNVAKLLTTKGRMDFVIFSLTSSRLWSTIVYRIRWTNFVIMAWGCGLKWR